MIPQSQTSYSNSWRMQIANTFNTIYTKFHSPLKSVNWFSWLFYFTNNNRIVNSHIFFTFANILKQLMKKRVILTETDFLWTKNRYCIGTRTLAMAIGCATPRPENHLPREDINFGHKLIHCWRVGTDLNFDNQNYP